MRRKAKGFRWIAFAAIFFLPSCSDPTEHYIDPEVDYGDGATYVPPTGTPTVDLGLYREQLYSTLNDGDSLDLLLGLQGGALAIEFAVRIKGVASPATLHCSCLSADESTVGDSEDKKEFVLASDGWLEIQSYLLVIDFTVSAGDTVALTCAVTDEAGRSSTKTVAVVLEGIL